MDVVTALGVKNLERDEWTKSNEGTQKFKKFPRKTFFIFCAAKNLDKKHNKTWRSESYIFLAWFKANAQKSYFLCGIYHT